MKQRATKHKPTPITWRQFIHHPRVARVLRWHGFAFFVVIVGLVFGSAIALIALAAVLLGHLALCLGALWPRSQWLGPNLIRLPTSSQEIWLTFDDGPHESLTPKVLDLLDEYHCKASFFVVAQRLQDPALAKIARDCVARGHCIENHSYSHPISFAFRGLNGLQDEIDQAQAMIEQVTGRTPQYFRAPAGIRNPLLQPLLELKGLQLASWTRRGFDTRERDSAKVIARLTKNLHSGDILLLHDGNSALDSAGNPVALIALHALLEKLQRLNLRATNTNTIR